MPPKRKLKRSKSDEKLDYPIKAKKEDANIETESPREDGPMHNIYRRIFVRVAIVFTMVMSARYFIGSPPEVPFVSVEEKVQRRFFEVPCSSDYAEDLKKFKACAPLKCGRAVMDYIVTKEEAKKLLNVAKKGMSLGYANGGATILDLHSGALTKGDKFVNVYSVLPDVKEEIFTKEDFRLYSDIKNRIKAAISESFQIPRETLYLTKPTFFSRLNSKPPQSVHDEYWHSHVDKRTYGSFDYTSLLYLTDYNLDFLGGRFFFKDEDVNRTVEPRAGRVSFFTSGSENTHFVERVHKGTRYAITVSFTCDPSLAISNPVLP